MGRILVVDDEPGLRAFVATALRRDGHEVTVASTGDEALNLLARSSFALVVTDLRMPGRDGLAVLDQVRAEHPETEVIVLTAHGTVDVAVDAMKRGAFDFLQKPVSSPGELRAVVTRALERHDLRARVEGARRADGLALTWGAPAMAPVVDALHKVAPTHATVLLLGASGVGKEVAARAVHTWSDRAEGPFVAVNCATLSPTLLESELFGHERGAFTGATARRRGKVELADGGTFFLDEVGELDLGLQARLLRVLQERAFERVGGEQTVHVDVRWVAATNRDLERRVREGSFREDLWYRLSVFPIRLPPLRERREDIPALAATLLTRVGASLGRPGLRLAQDAVAALQAAPWPGNVRELANTLERAAILAEGDELGAADLRLPGAPSPVARPTSLAEAEEAAIRAALDAVGGNRRKAAEILGIGERTLYEKLRGWRP